MSVCVVPFHVEIGRLFVYIDIGVGAVTNWGNMACSCRCSCCHRGQLCGCVVRLLSGRSLLLLLLLSVFGGSVDMSVVDSIIKLGEVLLAVSAGGEMPCGCTGCLSCRGKQSTSLLLLLSSWIGFGPNPRYADCFVLVGGL